MLTQDRKVQIIRSICGITAYVMALWSAGLIVNLFME